MMMLALFLFNVGDALASEPVLDGEKASNQSNVANNSTSLSEKQPAFEELTVIGTIDGKVHAIHKESGSHLWSVDTGGAMLSSFRKFFVVHPTFPTTHASLCCACRYAFLENVWPPFV
jgi:hypothetical protein